ncbi:hypothetical protein Acr_01g0012870 [Actinidia rufa]|uniref:Uncharacterized protein n=1 Tax=Actinidia rufa TaxID=165716 RepID=A0A7J0E4W5_9ERIC|nr:hypothetical protein Acr_01g0012870 [Actinidia rufa]
MTGDKGVRSSVEHSGSLRAHLSECLDPNLERPRDSPKPLRDEEKQVIFVESMIRLNNEILVETGKPLDANTSTHNQGGDKGNEESDRLNLGVILEGKHERIKHSKGEGEDVKSIDLEKQDKGKALVLEEPSRSGWGGVGSSPTVVQPWAEIAVDHSKPQMKLEYRPQNLEQCLMVVGKMGLEVVLSSEDGLFYCKFDCISSRDFALDKVALAYGRPTRVFEEMVENAEGLGNLSVLSTLAIKLKTSQMSYASLARICVEIEAKENLPDSFLIQCEEEVCEVDMTSSGAKGHGMTFVSLKRKGTLGLRMWIVGIGLQLPNMFGSSFLEGNNPRGLYVAPSVEMRVGSWMSFTCDGCDDPLAEAVQNLSP